MSRLKIAACLKVCVRISSFHFRCVRLQSLQMMQEVERIVLVNFDAFPFCFRCPVRTKRDKQVIFSVNPCSQSSVLLWFVAGEYDLSDLSPWQKVLSSCIYFNVVTYVVCRSEV